MATFSVHYDGDITIDHRVSVRVLGNTYTRMQAAIDRAYLVETYGRVVKYERLSRDQYQETDFIAQYPQEGGIVLDAIKDGAEGLIDRIYSATSYIFNRAVDEAFDQHLSIAQQYTQRQEYSHSVGDRALEYSDAVRSRKTEWQDAYSNRSIVKEIDPLVNQIARKDLESSTVDILLIGNKVNLPLIFNKTIAKNFHKIASDRELGPPMITHIWIRSLDIGNKATKPSAKVVNAAMGKEVVLQIFNEAGFEELHPYHGIAEGVRVHVCPIMEAGGFDVEGGDLMFLQVV